MDNDETNDDKNNSSSSIEKDEQEDIIIHNENISDDLEVQSTSGNQECSETTIDEINKLKEENINLQKSLESSNLKLLDLQKENAYCKKINDDLRSEMRIKLEQSKRVQDEIKREKESMVLKYAQAEQKSLDFQKKNKDLENKMKELKNSLDGCLNEKERIHKDLKGRLSDFSTYERELNNLKASITIAEQKIKNEEIKFKDEVERNKDIKRKYEEIQRNIIVLKEENNTLRTNCQEIVKTYQQSEDMKSNSLGNSLKMIKEELKKKEISYKELNENYSKTSVDLKSCQEKINNMTQELIKTKEKLKHSEADRLCQDESNKQLRDSIKSITFIKEDQAERIKNLEPLEKKLELLNLEHERLKSINEDLKKRMEENDSLLNNMNSKEGELLGFIQSLSDKNAELQSDKQELQSNQEKLQAQIIKLERSNKDLIVKLNYWEDKCKSETLNYKEERDKLLKQLESLNEEMSKSKNELSDCKDQIYSIQKKHKAHIKDLTRQLVKCDNPVNNNKLNRTNSGTGLFHYDSDSASLSRMNQGKCFVSTSDDSHKNSDQNLFTEIRNSESAPRSSPIQPDPTSTCTSSHTNGEEVHDIYTAQYDIISPLEIQTIKPHNQVMIEKIIRLQKQNAKLHEKIEFLTEHSHQLTQEIQKKSILLRNFFCQSEESGSVKSEIFDNNHRMMAKKSGIMASVFSSKPTDGTMTLELSLEINRQLQSVLEDTTLKNITLKDSINTLGEEVSKLSKENHKLKRSQLTN